MKLLSSSSTVMVVMVLVLLEITSATAATAAEDNHAEFKELSAAEAKEWLHSNKGPDADADQHHPFATLLFLYANYDGTAKRALPAFRSLCTEKLASSYSCASVDVADDASLQQLAKVSSLPALIVRTHVVDEADKTTIKNNDHVHYGPWEESDLRHAVREHAPRVCAVIPARFASTRFPHKMLRPIRGKAMIQNTYEQVIQASKVDAVWIATEGEELIQEANKFTHRVIRTSDKPINGMERIGEAEAHMPSSCRILVNVHGDEPFVHPEHIDKVVELFEQESAHAQGRRRGMGAASLRKRITSEQEARNRGIIKMVVRDDGTAQYLSRALVPHSKDGEYDPNVEYWSHINLHAFARGFASEYRAFPSPKAQLREDVEYLRILVMGYDIVTAEVGESERDVNTDEDYNYLVNKYGK